MNSMEDHAMDKIVLRKRAMLDKSSMVDSSNGADAAELDGVKQEIKETKEKIKQAETERDRILLHALNGILKELLKKENRLCYRPDPKDISCSKLSAEAYAKWYCGGLFAIAVLLSFSSDVLCEMLPKQQTLIKFFLFPLAIILWELYSGRIKL